jgi:hypothetical protein
MPDQPTPAAAGSAPARVIQKDAPWVRVLLFFLAIWLATDSTLIVVNLGWGKWPPEASQARIDALAKALLLAIAGGILGWAAFASPWLGTIRFSGGPIEIDAAGRE